MVVTVVIVIIIIINRKITVRALWVLKLPEPLRREIPRGGPLPEGLPDRPVPDNPEIPEIPEFPEFPEAPMMPESRSRRSPGRLRASILSDVESIFGSISVLFRGSIALLVFYWNILGGCSKSINQSINRKITVRAL